MKKIKCIGRGVGEEPPLQWKSITGKHGLWLQLQLEPPLVGYSHTTYKKRHLLACKLVSCSFSSERRRHKLEQTNKIQSELNSNNEP